jgi:hypothetical protein
MEESNDNTSNKDAQTSNNEQSTVAKKSHKKRNILIAVGIVFLLIFTTPIFIAGYFGFVPILSTIMGANNAKDLGVTYTQQDYVNYLAKTKTNLQNFSDAPANPDNPSKKIVFANPIDVTDMNTTQEELTAAINESEWSWMPIDNAQVKLSNGTVEISGNLKLDNIANFISFIGGVGYSQQDIDTAVGWAKRLLNNAPIYIKADGSVNNNQLTLSVQEVKVGRYTVPNDIAQTVLSTGTQNAISRTPGLYAKEANIIDGGLVFTGSHPTTIYVKTN